MRFRLVLGVMAVAGMLMSGIAQDSQASSRARYRIVDVGNLGGSFSLAGGINEKGDIEGYSTLSGDSQTHAYFLRNGRLLVIPGIGGPSSIAGWTPSETGQLAGEGETLAVDPFSEDFCGFGSSLTCVPFVWHNGTKILLPIPGGNNGSANGMNDRNEIVGKVEASEVDPDCPGPQVLKTHGILWKNGKIERNLPNFPGDAQGSGHQINNAGQIVGWSGSCVPGPFLTHALLWDGGNAIDLGTISGANNLAYDINNRTQVVGFSGLPDGSVIHGFIWQNGHMKDLGTLPGDVSSTAVGINDSGVIVGGSYDPDGNERAVVWQNGRITDLNTLIAANSPYYLIEAEDLNSRGEIIGVAFQISTGEIHGYVALPVQGGPAGAGNESTAASRRVSLPENVRQKIREHFVARQARRER